MKRSFFVLAALASSAFAELPQMSDKTEWLGYFVGWEERDFDFGIGADGEPIMQPKKNGKRIAHKHFTLHYLVQEEINGKWVTRQFSKEDGLSSANEKGLDPDKPVSVVTTVTGDTKVEWLHTISNGRVMVMPKILEKKTENPIRIGVSIDLPRLFRVEADDDKKDLKKMLGSDSAEGVRLKDGKKVRVKFIDTDTDINGEEYLKEGASEVEIKTSGTGGKPLVVKQGGEKVGRLDIDANGPLYNSFKVVWLADPAKLGEKDCYLSFALE